MDYQLNTVLEVTRDRKPDFTNLLAVLDKRSPARPTLFEFFLNKGLYSELAGRSFGTTNEEQLTTYILAFRNAGYDYVTTPTVLINDFAFPHGEVAQADSISLNDGNVIRDEESFAAYTWPDMDRLRYDILRRCAPRVPEGMKLVPCGPGGVLENVIGLVGYETLCYLIADQPELVDRIFAEVGSRLVEYYRRVVEYETVGAIISNDDWGFNTQTMLSPDDMRRFVFPWHTRIVAAAHDAGRPAILHSCGNPESVIADIVDDMGYDGRHSYEDNIIPVEDAYERWHGRVGILGGIDVHMMATGEPRTIYDRSRAMVEQSRQRGGYALGTGNSVPEYVPSLNYYAMIMAALEG